MSRVPVVCKLTLIGGLSCLVAAHGPAANASARPDATRQLIEATSLVNILRTDAEQATLIEDRLPEELPPELRSAFRRAIDKNLGYDALEVALVKSAAAALDASSLENNLRWWGSSSGRAISKVESSVYASVLPGSSFETYSPLLEAPHDISAATSAELTAKGRFSQFATDLLTSTAIARSCLFSTVNIGPDCHAGAAATNDVRNAEFSRAITAATNNGYSRVSSGDLEAYLVYLQSDSAQSVVRALRGSLLVVARQSWDNAVKQAAKALDDYARGELGSKRAATLRELTANVDNGQNLPRARLMLNLLRRTGPPDPAVLVQLARVALDQASDLTSSDVAPSVPRPDPASLDTAQRWVDQALALERHRAETLLMSGHIAYFKLDFKRSVDLLGQAKAAGTDNPWLRINLGDALWALGALPLNRTLAQQAADEFEAALKVKLPSAAELRAVHQLGAIYPELGDMQKADSFQRRYISMLEGRNKAYALHRYAVFLLYYAHDVDASMVAVRQAVQLADFEVGRAFLVDVLTVKAGTLDAAGRPREAAPFIAEARKIEPDLESMCPDLARLPATLPGVFGIHAAGLSKDFSGSIGGRTLVHASMYATADEIKQLLNWGANPNYLDSDAGAPLHSAIMGNNVAAVKVLLAHGANPLTPFVDGRTPAQLTDYPPDIMRTEIVALVAKAVATRTSATGPVGTPLRLNYRYRLKRAISGDRWGNDFAAGEELIYVGDCGYSDSSLACFYFKSVNKLSQVRDMALPKDQLGLWKNWFEELGPSVTPVSR